MQIKQLKLAGFKSFVDPTVIPFPSSLVAVVGPNGCGKSNVIDAVRWVMGESSAKNLRGESMADVIFNGSSQRKPLGQASVELIFDNSFGRLTGQYASYQEISVKRIVSRDGESSYYLNNSRCRRRDINDIFLGTGAGARGYSIIGQGTISRIVEARPEELRLYLEEAAGVSKYKERRRETLLRIEHSRENLTRVADIRDELAKQIQRLERQAQAAKRYKTLKAEERLCKAEIIALKWQALTQEQQYKQKLIIKLSNEYEFYQAKSTEAYKKGVELKEKLHDSNEQFQQTQAKFYQLATDIARLEESIQQQQREKQRLETDQQQLQSDWQTASSQLVQDKEAKLISEQRTLQLEKNVASLQEELANQQQSLQVSEENERNWNAKTQQAQTALMKVEGEINVEQLRLKHLTERKQQLLARCEKINVELTSLATTTIDEFIEEQQNNLLVLTTELDNVLNINEHYQKTVIAQRTQLTEAEKKLHQLQDKAHQLTSQHGRVLAMQQTALGRGTQQTESLWQAKPRLVELLTVEKDWQLACEFVLGESLQAIILDSLDEFWAEMDSLSTPQGFFITARFENITKKVQPRLIDKITGLETSCLQGFEKIFTASSLTEARLLLSHLKQDESVITAEGYWLGQGWLKIASFTQQEETSLLQRQDELQLVKASLAEKETEIIELKTSRDNLHQQLRENEQSLENTQAKVLAARESLRSCEIELKQKLTRLEQEKSKKMALNSEQEELREALEELIIDLENTESNYNSLQEKARLHAHEQKQLLAEKTNWQTSLLVSKQSLNETSALFHSEQLQTDREKLKTQQLEENINREQHRLETLAERLENVANRLIELETPDANLKLSLHDKIEQYNELEIHLANQREQLDQLKNEHNDCESVVHNEEKNAKAIQEKIQQEQMQEQALMVRATGLVESLVELDQQLEHLLANMPENLSQTLREQELLTITDKIKRLGAINLAAIEEYEAEFQRKHYLDEQYLDLTEALTTLESAIEKMDQETNQRLRITFDEVNKSFQSLFPRLFGGGRAMLELTCDNLLEAGILVMAQPPGKRNSTIHLLSGGEKAMTAVALVFAIFQLNPSPFCMLDEVDAPLDDVNVGRFCALVKEMSQVVQFLFITHNKVTMELADHLIGVTMREPGVSRVVTVDVEQALAMTEV